MIEPLLEHPRARPGDPDQETSRLYAEHGDKIYRYCLGRLRSREEAEDATQNTFLRVCTALRKGTVPELEGPWLYKIAHNVCLSRRLGSSRRARVETPADLDTLGERAAAHTPDADELFGLGEALAEMPANLRRPLLLREWQGMSYMEIADALGVSHSAVETLIFRARRHLAQALTDSVKKTGRAVASIFNIRWLYDLVRSLGGAGSAGLAAGAVVVVAIGGGVAIDLAVQHASASHSSASPTAVAQKISATTGHARAENAPGGASGASAGGGSAVGPGGAGPSAALPGASSPAAGSAGAAGTSGATAVAAATATPSSGGRPTAATSSAPSGAAGAGNASSSSSGSSKAPPPAVAPPQVPDPGSGLPPVPPPPVIDPPAIDLPAIDPPAIDPPAIDPPAIDPPAIDPPAIDPPSIDPPTIDPPPLPPLPPLGPVGTAANGAVP